MNEPHEGAPHMRTLEVEAVSKLKKCQGKCDFHGGKRAVADEIRAALR